MIKEFQHLLDTTKAKQNELDKLVNTFKKSIGNIKDENGTLDYLSKVLTDAMNGKEIDENEIKEKLKNIL